jgi:hypothetical protein
MNVYDRPQGQELKRGAAVLAALVYDAAVRLELRLQFPQV